MLLLRNAVLPGRRKGTEDMEIKENLVTLLFLTISCVNFGLLGAIANSTENAKTNR